MLTGVSVGLPVGFGPQSPPQEDQEFHLFPFEGFTGLATGFLKDRNQAADSSPSPAGALASIMDKLRRATKTLIVDDLIISSIETMPACRLELVVELVVELVKN